MLETAITTRTMEFVPHISQIAEPAVRLHLLVVDADTAIRSACAEIAASLGYAVESTGDLGQARSLLRAGGRHSAGQPARGEQPRPGACLRGEAALPADFGDRHDRFRLGECGRGSDALRRLRLPDQALRHGRAFHRARPRRRDPLDRYATRQLRERLRLSQGLGAMIGRSGEMEKLYRILSKVAQSSHPVLVLGESGTGKELVARTIHAYGPNSQKPSCRSTAARWCPR